MEENGIQRGMRIRQEQADLLIRIYKASMRAGWEGGELMQDVLDDINKHLESTLGQSWIDQQAEILNQPRKETDHE